MTGRVLIVGGSEEYVGAVYYAAMTAMRAGVDIVYIACFNEAVVPLKVLLPEAIVISAESPNFSFDRFIPKCDAVLIGSGYGRGPTSADVFRQCLDKCQEHQKWLVVDGDGLWHLTNLLEKDNSFLKAEHTKVILTPNYNESKMLSQIDDPQPIFSILNQQSWLIKKGLKDEIFSHAGIRGSCEEPSTWRRCGGQGDLLAGAVCAATALANARNRRGDGALDQEQQLAVMYWACVWVRRCAKKAEPKAGLITSDILKQMALTSFISLK
eukprot:Gregarina_sp_Poly_1__4799@NODE_2559_length_1981_cov_146_012539_g1626_i0_p2_GENE_NODE_2559_length_1981_cov_146_012539_g1626_i0NODE_2559_length_1981_cov_146_012539_g1626_i0_p2_ORF_typecomplete_len268_score40_30Carb_kinase/PF01256_17/4_9e46TnpB_IS66/PF05717_13/0_08_NODE_2559_length_1981_cov_146_012539_g1626_i09941797